MADVTLKYKGATIGELSETGSKTLETAGKYCEADILLEYVKSGGAVLPSVISKIDGGSFTPTADVQGTSYWINHNLGVAPKQVVMWTDDNDLVNTENAVAQRYLIFCEVIVREFSTGSATNGAVPSFLYRNTNGQAANTGSPMTSAQKNLYFTSSQFCVPTGAIYLKANTEYKWIAFA